VSIRAVRLRRGASLAARHELGAGAVVVLSAVCLGGAATVQLALTDHLGVFFGICFVLAALTAALLVRTSGFFTVGVLPPLLMLGIIVAVGAVAPSGIDAPGLADDAGFLQRVIAGVVSQAPALVIGHGVALGVIGLRVHSAPSRPRR
jgi:hypothetical protein